MPPRYNKLKNFFSRDFNSDSANTGSERADSSSRNYSSYNYRLGYYNWRKGDGDSGFENGARAGTAGGYESGGYDPAGKYASAKYDSNGKFDARSDSTGFDAGGYESGPKYDSSGKFAGRSVTSSKYDTTAGFDSKYDVAGYNSAGYNSAGYNSAGYNSAGYNAAGYDKSGAKYDPNASTYDFAGKYHSSTKYDSNGKFIGNHDTGYDPSAGNYDPKYDSSTGKYDSKFDPSAKYDKFNYGYGEKYDSKYGDRSKISAKRSLSNSVPNRGSLTNSVPNRTSLTNSVPNRTSLTNSASNRSSLTNSVPSKRYDSWSNYTNPNKVPVRSNNSRHKEKRRDSSSLINNSNDPYYQRSYPKTVDRYSLKSGYYDKNRSNSSFKRHDYDTYVKYDTSNSFDGKSRYNDDDDNTNNDNENHGEENDEDDDQDDQDDDDDDDQEDDRVPHRFDDRNEEDHYNNSEYEEHDQDGTRYDNTDDNQGEKDNENDYQQHHSETKSEIDTQAPNLSSTSKFDSSETPSSHLSTLLNQSFNEITYPEGCLYPKLEYATKYEELLQEFKNRSSSEDIHLKYTVKEPIKNFSDYPFWNQNFDNFIQAKSNLESILKTQKSAIDKKAIKLWNEYKDRVLIWEEESNKMDQQLQILHPPEDELKREIEASDIKKQQAQTPDQPDTVNEASTFSSRRSRRHGDYLAEDEFQKILMSLSQEEDEDPLVRAERLSATIPDMILDPVEREKVKFLDSNNFAHDRVTWAERVKTDFFDNFSEKEHELFSEGFCLYPKRFGAISNHMGGLRSASDCVVHYYVTKKEVNYKQILALFKKKASKKRGRGKQGRSRNTSGAQTPISTPVNETASSSYMDIEIASLPKELAIATESLTEEQYTDLGRKKRAAAPEFKEAENGGKKKRKKKEEVESSEPPTSQTQDLKTTDDTEIKENSNDNEGKVDAEEKVAERETEMEGETHDERDDRTDQEREDDMNQLSDSYDAEQRRKGKTISSYWSITEANQFPELLEKYGTKWTTIADELATKSATMVRNYFQRNYEKNEWNRIAEDADLRLRAKFAAVLQTDEENPGIPVPIGTFQHNKSNDSKPDGQSSNQENEDNSQYVTQNNSNNKQDNPDIKQAIQSSDNKIIQPDIHSEIQAGKQALPMIKVNINSLLSESPVKSEPKAETKFVSGRSSIMSLLNSEMELPVKAEKPKESFHSKNLHDLLNAP